ncbi:MAG: sigma-54 interaction domain-containing protein [Candidatus Krumholzibacteriia bacterium]
MAWAFWAEEIRGFPLLGLGAGSALWVVRRDGEGEQTALRLLYAHAWPHPPAGWAPGPGRGAADGTAARAVAPALPLQPLWRAVQEGVGAERPWRGTADPPAEGRRSAGRAGRPVLWVEPLRRGAEVAGAFALAFDASPPWDEAVRLWGTRFAARVAPLLDCLPPWPATPRLEAAAATAQPTLFPLPPPAGATAAPRRGRAEAGGLPLPRPVPVPGVPGAVGVSAEFLACCDTALAVAEADVNVLLHGESGTGKEILARAVHLASTRRDRAFLGENCAALPEGLLESELFGHRAGAFTGAAQEKAGLLEAASGGTFFLDEIGDMPLALQIKLLRVMQERRVRRIGELESRPVNLRWIAATHKDLNAEIAAGRFRLDLYYRLHVVRLTIPPLRRRPEDVPHLLAYFLQRHGRAGAGRRIQESALAALQSHRWPGNARELENEARRLLALHGEAPVIRFEHLSPEVRGAADRSDGDEDLGQLRPLDEAAVLLERHLIRKAVEACAGRKAAAARRLGLSRQGLYRKIRRYGLLDLLPGAGEGTAGPDDPDGEPAAALAAAGPGPDGSAIRTAPSFSSPSGHSP